MLISTNGGCAFLWLSPEQNVPLNVKTGLRLLKKHKLGNLMQILRFCAGCAIIRFY